MNETDYRKYRKLGLDPEREEVIWEYDNENESNSSDFDFCVICPCCGSLNEIWGEIDCYKDDGYHLIECEICSKEFLIEITLHYTRMIGKIKKKENNNEQN